MISDHLYNFETKKNRKSKMSNDNILNFDAKEAKELSEKIENEELSRILEQIKEAASDPKILDNRTLHVYEKLKNSTLNELEKKGFNIIVNCNNPDLMDNLIDLIYTITW